MLNDDRVKNLEGRIADKEYLIELYSERCETQKEQIRQLESRLSALQNSIAPKEPIVCSHLKLQKGGLSC